MNYFQERSHIMLKDKYPNRNLSEVFKELQEVKNNSFAQQIHERQQSTKKRATMKGQLLSRVSNTFTDIKLSHILIVGGALFLATTILLTKNIFAKSNDHEYELNYNALNIQQIISQNAEITKFKEQVVKECNIVYATKYNNNPTLPKGEQIVTQQGKLGKEKVTAVRTYENQQLVEEVVLTRETMKKPTAQLVDVGTSEFLAKHKIHIGDTLYLTETTHLKKSATATSDDITEIKDSLDVKLLELKNEQWCKVSYEDKEGYLQTAKLTSATSSPDIAEKCRIQKIMMNVNIDMELNKSSGLTKDDFKKVLTGLNEDRLHIFQDNYEVFYNMDTKYNINGIFLASIAIHESAWGTSKIANDKKNLFGYGAYDRSPYESSFSFDDYSNGVETVAKALVKYYLNPEGTEIYDGEKAKGTYYESPTVTSVNKRYATDPEWHTKVYSYMEMLYNRLP